jgi:hypothetical protein
VPSQVPSDSASRRRPRGARLGHDGACGAKPREHAGGFERLAQRIGAGSATTHMAVGDRLPVEHASRA